VAVAPGSGRDRFIEKNWKDKDTEKTGHLKHSEGELRKKLSPLQYRVTQEEAMGLS